NSGGARNRRRIGGGTPCAPEDRRQPRRTAWASRWGSNHDPGATPEDFRRMGHRKSPIRGDEPIRATKRSHPQTRPPGASGGRPTEDTRPRSSGTDTRKAQGWEGHLLDLVAGAYLRGVQKSISCLSPPLPGPLPRGEREQFLTPSPL